MPARPRLPARLPALQTSLLERDPSTYVRVFGSLPEGHPAPPLYSASSTDRPAAPPAAVQAAAAAVPLAEAGEAPVHGAEDDGVCSTCSGSGSHDSHMGHTSLVAEVEEKEEEGMQQQQQQEEGRRWRPEQEGGRRRPART